MRITRHEQDVSSCFDTYHKLSVHVLREGMLLFLTAALAHGTRFGISAVSIAPGDDDAVWAVASGWGVIHTVDRGANWEWLCEESIGATAVYDVESLDSSRALLATSSGVLRVDPGCTVTPLPGLPEGAQVAFLEEGDGDFLAAAYAEGVSGLWRCGQDSCVESGLVGEGVYVKSVRMEAGTWWATTVDGATLSSSLLTSPDGESWAAVTTWEDGTVDPRVLHVSGNRVLVWDQPRDETRSPALRRSEDGGVSFVEVFAVGSFTDAVPTLLPLADGRSWYLGTDNGRTFFSAAIEAGFIEVTETAPAVRAADTSGNVSVIGADHFADGFDIAWQRFAGPWEAAGCLDAALVPGCAQECIDYVPSFLAAGLYGGGECQEVLEPAPESGGCGGGAAGVVGLTGLSALGRRGRRGQGAGSR